MFSDRVCVTPDEEMVFDIDMHNKSTLDLSRYLTLQPFDIGKDEQHIPRYTHASGNIAKFHNGRVDNASAISMLSRSILMKQIIYAW